MKFTTKEQEDEIVAFAEKLSSIDLETMAQVVSDTGIHTEAVFTSLMIKENAGKLTLMDIALMTAVSVLLDLEEKNPKNLKLM